MLKSKADEFGDDPLMTYLRITLGLDEVTRSRNKGYLDVS